MKHSVLKEMLCVWKDAVLKETCCVPTCATPVCCTYVYGTEVFVSKLSHDNCYINKNIWVSSLKCVTNKNAMGELIASYFLLKLTTNLPRCIKVILQEGGNRK